MKCPNCNVNLIMADKQGVEIDYCPECRGIWLDRGELDKIIERSSGCNETSRREYREEPREDSYYEGHKPHKYDNDHHYDNDHYKKHKKRNFLEDIFDFG